MGKRKQEREAKQAYEETIERLQQEKRDRRELPPESEREKRDEK